jgi:hypothetical protein
MEYTTGRSSPTPRKGIRACGLLLSRCSLRRRFLVGSLAIVFASGLERLVGLPLARAIGLSKVPVLFGVDIALKTPLLLPASLLYD